jgi:hypothetical protein
MPAKSKSQQRLMAAAEHGAAFPLAKKLRSEMTHGQLHDFAVGSMTNKPEHVKGGATGRKAAKDVSSSVYGAHPHANLGGYLHPKKG